MDNPQLEHSPPRIIAEDEAGPDQLQLIEALEKGINDNPELYDSALYACTASLAEDVTEALRLEAQYLRKFPADSDIYPNAFDNWLKFMKRRVDSVSRFDDETEAVIINDPEFLQIRNDKKLGPDQRLTATRSYRLHIFIGRVSVPIDSGIQSGAAWYTKQVSFEDFSIKDSVVIVYTGKGKGKTSAALGLMTRALGNRNKVAFIQFIKFWGVGEHVFINDIMPLYKDQLHFYKGGKGFYNAGELSEQTITEQQHKEAATKTYQEALHCTTSGKYDLVICDEINNAVHDGLITKAQLKKLIVSKSPATSLCLTGRDFPKALLTLVDIATDMNKIKHHFDDKFLANRGIDY